MCRLNYGHVLTDKSAGNRANHYEKPSPQQTKKTAARFSSRGGSSFKFSNLKVKIQSAA
jgi:hypothetical protein